MLQKSWRIPTVISRFEPDFVRTAVIFLCLSPMVTVPLDAEIPILCKDQQLCAFFLDKRTAGNEKKKKTYSNSPIYSPLSDPPCRTVVMYEVGLKQFKATEMCTSGRVSWWEAGGMSSIELNDTGEKVNDTGSVMLRASA
jgi:hypothetical protein